MATASAQVHDLDYYSSRLSLDFHLSIDANHSSTLDDSVPGFPSRYCGERVWTGSEMALKEAEWLTVLSEPDQIHVMEALRDFQGCHLTRIKKSMAHAEQV